MDLTLGAALSHQFSNPSLTSTHVNDSQGYSLVRCPVHPTNISGENAADLLATNRSPWAPRLYPSRCSNVLGHSSEDGALERVAAFSPRAGVGKGGGSWLTLGGCMLSNNWFIASRPSSGRNPCGTVVPILTFHLLFSAKLLCIIPNVHTPKTTPNREPLIRW